MEKQIKTPSKSEMKIPDMISPLLMSSPRESTLTMDEVLSQPARKLIVYNDDVNTFEWVIQSLVEICEHTPEQAEQCAWIIHTKGKYAVKTGSFDELRPRCEALLDRGLSATIS